MKMFTPQGEVAEVAPNQVQILLKAGWTREKKSPSQPVQSVQSAQPTEPVEKQEESMEEKKIRKILRPKE